jgi:hypothetical protein
MINLPAHFIECDGHLYDTRRVDWSNNPLRLNYAVIQAPGNRTHAIRAAIRNPYAWPGGYALFALTTDGGCLCMDCVKKNYRNISDSVRKGINDGWRISGFDCTANSDGPLCCDHCNAELIQDESNAA